MNILTADFHTHILPRIDDGCRSIEESVEMIQLEVAQGIRTIFLTPHFHAQHSNPKLFVENRRDSLSKLMTAFADNFEVPNLILGAEVSYCPGMGKWEELNMLTLGESGCIMIEMPVGNWGEHVFHDLETIYYERGIIPIIAHIERYFSLYRLNKVLQRLSDLPVLIQCNCDFICNKRTRKLALKLLSSKKIHIIGSDCHSASWRAPNIQNARNVLLQYADASTLSFLSEIEAMVVQGNTRR